MDIRPAIQEACDNLRSNNEDFTDLDLNFNNQVYFNQSETDALIEALRVNTHVQDMYFINCLFYGTNNSTFLDFVAETLIPSHPSLGWLMLKGNHIAGEAAGKIAHALMRNATLQSFVLDGNMLSRNAIQILAEGIRHNSSVNIFGLTHNGLGFDGCRTVVTSISAKPNFNLFQFLYLSYNDIGVEGSRVIADFIPKAKSLERLLLDGNNVGDEGCQPVASALTKTRSLKVIGISRNNIGDRGCLALANGLRKNCVLVNMDLAHNHITGVGAAALQATLQHANFMVRELDLSNNDEVADDEREQISLLCNANRQLQDAFLQYSSVRPATSLGLLPRILDLFVTKPDLLYALIKDKPELFLERRAQRKRKQPERLQY